LCGTLSNFDRELHFRSESRSDLSSDDMHTGSSILPAGSLQSFRKGCCA
jgi:hypothetical protein